MSCHAPTLARKGATLGGAGAGGRRRAGHRRSCDRCAGVSGSPSRPRPNRSAASNDPDYAAGKQALDQKDWGEAVKYFLQAALRDPDNADLQNYLGFSYRNLGQLDAAFQHYRRALELNPGTVAPTNTRAKPI